MLCKNKRPQILLFFLLFIAPLYAYENLTPAQVYQRMMSGDSLQLLDVREVSEYRAGHMAEPAGRPVITPANMPWSSGVLESNYTLLPKDIDLIVNCHSGGRSAAVTAFLEYKGFTRIYNMTSGFSGWSYESRTGRYGDGSGAWVSSDAVTITCSQDAAATIRFSDGANPSETFYVEMHKIDKAFAPFENLPESSLLFSTTVLNEFGLPLFAHDTLATHNQVEYRFTINTSDAFCQAFIPSTGWIDIESHTTTEGVSIISNTVYKWLLIRPVETIVEHKPPRLSSQLVKAYPNPFNDMLKINAPANAQISIYDVRGRFITTVQNNSWHPGKYLGSGIYFIQVRWHQKIWRQKVVYSK